MTEVRWEKTLFVEITVIANEFCDSETSTESWRITKEHDDFITVRMPGNSLTYRISDKAVEAIYDLHQEVPR